MIILDAVFSEFVLRYRYYNIIIVFECFSVTLRNKSIIASGNRFEVVYTYHVTSRNRTINHHPTSVLFVLTVQPSCMCIEKNNKKKNNQVWFRKIVDNNYTKIQSKSLKSEWIIMIYIIIEWHTYTFFSSVLCFVGTRSN